MKGLNLHILLTRLPISVTGNHAFGALTIMLITHIFYHAAQGYASGFLQDVPGVCETVWQDTPCKKGHKDNKMSPHGRTPRNAWLSSFKKKWGNGGWPPGQAETYVSAARRTENGRPCLLLAIYGL